MISFRFHVVSITAVFLAIAIGVVVGSTFVDRAIVDNLRDRIDEVSTNLDARREEIDQLQGDLGRMEDYADASAAFAVSGRLADQAVLVVVLRGVDDEPARRLVELAGQAGAAAPGLLWVEPRWALDEESDVEELAELVGARASSPDVVRAEAWDDVLEELHAAEVPVATTTTTLVPGVEPTETTDTTIAEPVDPVVLRSLLEAGFLSFEPTSDGATLDAVVGRSPAVVGVTGTSAEAALVPLLGPFLEALLAADLDAVAAEVYRQPGDDEADAPERGELAVAAVPGGAAASTVSIVDHLDLRVGQVSAVLALSDLRRDVTGHYGFGDGSAGVLPTWTPL